jgi:hypothetical protein
VKRNVANHVSGLDVFFRMNHRPAPKSAPTILELLAMTRDNQPLGFISGEWLNELHPLLEGSAPEDLEAMQMALRANGHPGRASRAYSGGAELLDRIRHATKFTLEDWSADPGTEQVSIALQRSLWMLENDLTSSLSLHPAGFSEAWDSHENNLFRQQVMSATYLPLVARFLANLKTRKNAHGPLDQTTTVLITSEIGRFPLLNGWNGKDHLSEAPVLLFGAGIRGGRAFGRTGSRMEALDVSLQTGEPAAAGSRITMEDLGTTLLRKAGFNQPSVYGYRGSPLRFLETS